MFLNYRRVNKPLAYGLLAVIILFIPATIFLGPRALALYHQVRGGMILTDVIGSYLKASPNSLVCELPPLESGPASARLQQAISQLETAQRYDSRLAQTYLLLGRAYCISGKPEDAVNALLKYAYLHPENPLGSLELGFAYEATCKYENIVNEHTPSQEINTGVLCQNGDLKTRIAQSWIAAGISAEQLYNRADLAFASQQYDDAGTWFQLAALLGEKPDARRQFEWAVSNVLVGKPLPEELDANAVSVYTLSEYVKIGGEYLQWMRPEDNYWNIKYGQRLYEHPTGEPGVGGLWWQGSGVAIVQAPCTAEYSIRVRAMHKSDTTLAGQLQVENDLKPEAIFTLSQDWQEYEINITLTKGNHILGIRYVEDVGDAMINWVSVEPMKECER